MKYIRTICILIALLISQTGNAREIAVLLPVVGPITTDEKSELTKAVLGELSAQFELKHGAEVDRFVRKTFHEESKKSDCDETNCYRHIAEHYHAEKIVALRIVPVVREGLVVTFHLYDIVTEKMIASEKRSCEKCTTQKLKVIVQELASRLTQSK